MTDRQWETFFSLLDQIVQMPGKTASEKAEILKEKAEEHGSTTNLEELGAWMAE